jgi:hypothetical protein
MVYMSSSGLDWVPLINSWFKKNKVDPDDAAMVKKLFEDYFSSIYKWCYTSLNYVIDMLQVGMTVQLKKNQCTYPASEGVVDS